MSEKISMLESIGFSSNQVAKIKTKLNESSGIILVSGSTGCGASTTIKAILEQAVRDENHLIAVIERQSEMNISDAYYPEPDKELSSNEKRKWALIRSLKNSPNIIALDEISNDDEASLLKYAGMTGHTVLSRIYAKNITNVFEKLSTMSFKDWELRDTNLMKLVIGQKLVRKLCQNCSPNTNKKQVHQKDELVMQAWIESLPGNVKSQIRYQNDTRCPHCQNGSTRTAIVEFAEMTNDLIDAYMSKNDDKIKVVLNEQGEKPSGQICLEKILKGEIDPYDALSQYEFLEIAKHYKN